MFIVVLKKSVFFFFSCEDHFKSPLSPHCIGVPELISCACHMQPSAVSAILFGAMSCYTNSWSVSLPSPSFPYSFHIPAISSVA